LPSLEDLGLINRRVYAQVSPRVEDTLTPAGRTLQPVLTALAEWGRDHAL
jgi:DNA-binding HxlR family transcriptional regulator